MPTDTVLLLQDRKESWAAATVFTRRLTSLCFLPPSLLVVYKHTVHCVHTFFQADAHVLIEIISCDSHSCSPLPSLKLGVADMASSTNKSLLCL